ncbi:alpha-glucosidase [Sphingomonas kyeonggiensis]|uniref:alpha-amylase family glycosyl hydrolase n=1 Tax=Sphingomonas kyeonggiensis TaxID=1268553 RepID=UPI0027855116|nr:alpha-amylase family glycosyl hydrolase [Sphingomonas kyeonggiensis]MDQ0251956.1 alpha-glucosidase [Sphingomonas kyeonggiensis]
MTQLAAKAETLDAQPWWKGASIYQIYPRSFFDSNGDGIGDLPGITARLDYVASLGVDAIWLSPFFKSPMADFGYDVADYRDVDPIFGTLADFDALIARAHALGLRVLIDQVWAHTSDQHAWFVESRASRDNPKANWYVWHDARPEGSPPTNWQSVFGGPAWTWDARRGQYYMHNFLKEQPQLNCHLPEVQEELLAITRFWLDRGVDGFRIDAINFSMHDPEFRDNPPAPDSNTPRTRPFDFQLHIYNQSHADIPPFLERLRGVFDEYPDRFTVAEVGGADADREMKLFTAGNNRLNTAYGFDFLYAAQLTGSAVREALENWPSGSSWPSWAFENHDAPRAVSRWAAPEQADAFARMKMLLLAALRGNIFLYYGEELGLDQVEIAFEDLQDPEAIANWPRTLSRDGARTPMPWEAQAPQLGFTSGKPWLPVGPNHAKLAIDVQNADAGSLLAWTRQVLALRNASPALRTGDIAFLDTPGGLLAFEREGEGERLLCLFNLGDTAQQFAPADAGQWRPLLSTGEVSDWTFAPYSGLIARTEA